MTNYDSLENLEVYIDDDQYYMKTTSSIGEKYAVNLETGILESAPNHNITETDIHIADLWE